MRNFNILNKFAKALDNRDRFSNKSRRWRKWNNVVIKLKNSLTIKFYEQTVMNINTSPEINVPHNLIKIKSIEEAGGACPYQISATTENGEYFYLRYRMGNLKYGVWKSIDDFYNSCPRNYLFSSHIGDDFDEVADDELFKKHLSERVIFSENFKFESKTYDIQ
jgi:hypothetical protein